MKVDMSPEAVTQRLRTMDDLWLLSVKLMNAKKVKTTKKMRISDGEASNTLGAKKSQNRER